MGQEMTPDEAVGSHIAALRKAAGLSQREVAEAMKVDFGWQRDTVSAVEAGHRRLGLDELAAMAAYFELPVEALITGPGLELGYSHVHFGGRVLPARDWLNLWTTWDWRKGPPGRHHRAAIDRLFSEEDRPWAQIWRRRRQHPAESFRRARERILSQRSRHPGPIFVTTADTPVTYSAAQGPWSANITIRLEPGVPYVARDDDEAAALAAMQDQGLVVSIPRHTAHYIRRRKGKG